jgi:flagellar capping protein FliD
VIDLRFALTTDDVLKAINENEAIDVSAKVVGDRIVLSDVSGGAGNLRVDEVNGGRTAADLGLGGINVASSTATGQDVLQLYRGMDLNKLGDGNGVKLNDALPELNVSFRDGTSLQVDFRRLPQSAVKATVTTTAAAGVNGQLKFTAVQAGAEYNGVTIQFIDSGAVTSGADVVWDANAKTLTFDIAAGSTTATDVLVTLNTDPIASQIFTASNGVGGNGSGLIDLTDGGVTAGGNSAVSAGSEKTLGDLLDTINAADPTRLQAALSADGDRIVLTDLTANNGGTFQVTSLNGTGLAESLGLAGDASGATLNGRRLLGGLKSTLLDSLNGGAGLGTLGLLSLTDRSGATTNVNLAAAESLDDVIGAINSAGLGIEAAYNSARNGIVLKDTTGSTASPLIVANGDATNTATKLKIEASTAAVTLNSGSLNRQVVSEQTLLSSYFGGKGVKLGSIRITDSAGLSSTVNLSSIGATTIGNVIDAINATSIGVEARINDAGDGLILVDTAGGSGKLKVEDIGVGTSAADLRIKGESTTATINGTPTEVIDGSTTLTVTLDADDTLTDLVTKINELGVGASASIITQTAGAVSHHLSLLSRTDGKPGELLIDGSSLGLSFDEIAAAQNGLLQFGSGATAGTLLSSTNNVYTDALPGIDITVSQASTETINVTVGESPSSVANALQTFVDNYNKLRDKFATYTAFNAVDNTKGVLFGSSETLRLDNDLTRMITGRIVGLGEVETLAELGISIDDTGKLAFDSTKFNARFAEDGEAIKQFFTNETSGFAKKIDDVFERLVGRDNSVLINRVEAINRQVEDATERIAAFDERLEKARDRLLKEFYNMELLIGRIRSNLDAIGSIQYIAPVSRSSSS